MRRGIRRAMPLVVVLLSGLALAGAAPVTRSAPPAALLAAPAATGYRLGYTSTEQPALRVAIPGQSARPLLTGDDRGDADLDADTRAGMLVWVSRRAADAPADPGGDLYLRRPGSGIARLTSGPGADSQPALSPDGRRVAFVSDRGGSADLWLVVTDGSTPRRLTDHPGEDIGPSWSPDSTRIMFSSTRDDPAGDLYVLDVASGRTTRLTSDPGADTQPAWSPDGTRIAFTTTRFAPADGSGAATEVVTMPATGGPVTRVVPAPWDSAQPAWAPDSRRIAFVSTRFDNAGDVYLLDRGTVTPVAASELAERHPVWQANEVIFTGTEVEPSTDVWTADSNGQDRRDRTVRPGYDETGPAFTADGTRLAYSAEQPAGGARIVVADGDGRNPRMLAPPGTQVGDEDTDPTWSPDGTAIAFTRRPAGRSLPTRILVARAADGHLLGQLPVPHHLAAQDTEPAWSPDGTRIAISRTATRRQSIVDPTLVDQPSLPGREFTVTTRVRTPAVPPRPDIVFLVDNTGSMAAPGEDGSSVIEQLKARIPEVIDSVRADQPDAHFALATFGGQGDPRLYDPRLALTDVDADIQAAVDTLEADSGYGTENWFYALRQIARNDRIGFRTDSSRIVVLISDTYSIDQTTPTGEQITRESLGDELVGAGISLIGVPITGAGGELGLNYDGIAESLAQQTGGRLTPNSQPGQLIPAIKDAIRSLTLTVTPVVEHCDDGLDVTFTPNPARVPAGEPAVFQELVTVASGATPGAVLRCVLRFDVNAPQPGLDSRQDLVVRVAHPDHPFVRVDDVTVAAEGTDGTVVQYQASAVDAAGRPLIPRCEPASGSRFPIGQTVVTCTAVDSAGRSWQDVATITVLDKDGGGTRIWVVRIAAATPDAVSFGDQIDVSARVSEPCRARTGDRGPAWSPDSTALAFTDGGRLATLCVVTADGTNARTPLSAVDQADRPAADPAWAPDGSRIAVALSLPGPGLAAACDCTMPSSIVTVPSGGGPATTVIRHVGYQPVYQTLPVPDLSLTVSVGGQPGYVGGDSMPVTYTVRNTSRQPASNAWLSLALPPALLPAVSMDSRCDAATGLCRLGTLGIGDQQVVNVVLPARAATAQAVTGRLTATVGEGTPTTRFAQAPLLVLAPTLVVEPRIGPPGFVTKAVGTNFPPGATVRLRWDVGITATPNTVVVQPDGTFQVQVLILRKDPLGPRYLGAVRVTGGSRFGPVRTEQPFLVVPRALDPPNFHERR
ncbi:VWA domain-containing protein [Micromonospora polyrhachis]|uniref:Tol biopolymer transport system component n=1 Tax=Micromonospora polyrhachis TaxID=1282883 RepID=A0A7W7SZE1_9ACTN|nr:VWA domain-containing protein [Micromonospora polyrhachis]MBB4962430.1 Tol biopolymer transport system component [Micromonospora polyrhachis]